MNATLPLLSTLQDDELAVGTASDFADRLHARAWNYALSLYDPVCWEKLPWDDSEQYRQRLVFYLRRRSWAEWYFGTVTPARQILLLGGGQSALALRIARQIQDEVRHHDAFAAGARKLGGEWRVECFPEPPNLLEMRDAQVAARSAGELAAANQLAGEVVLMIHGQESGNVLRTLVPDDVQELMEDVETDEPAHIELGRELVIACAQEPEQRRRMAQAQERFLNALGRQHTAELEQLGALRTQRLPEFAAAGVG